MRTMCIWCLAIVFVPFTSGAAASRDRLPGNAPSTFKEHSFKASNGKSLRFSLFVPKDPPPGKTLPLVVCLHGAGGGTHAARVLAEPDQQKKRPCYILAPACDGKGDRWVKTEFRGGKGRAVEPELMETIDEVIRKHAIDPARLYVTGQSMGGVGTWGLIAAHAQRFAAAVPVCGLWDPADAKKMTDVPIWAFHGANDNAVPVSGSRDMIEALRKLGAKPKYTEYPNLAHGVWGEAYATEALWEWVFAQQRPANRIQPGAVRAGEKSRPPNIIFILTDDQGYGDVGCFGAKKIKTPNLDRMAREGMRFTNFYVTEAVCSASRASILTGSYAVRVGLQGALNHTSKLGINEREPNLARMLKLLGYRTALFGKWHLGHHARFHPLRHGFDEFVGTMFPNDCSNQFHPIIRTFPPFTVYEGEKAILKDPDQSIFTPMLTKRAVDFIGKNKDQPFFLYLAHVMPHVPIHVSAPFRGKSAGGAYGDVIEELDSSVGEILAALKANGVDDNTLIIFTSDNGPFLSYGSHAGFAGLLRGGKLTAFEGGVRVPCIMRWSGRIPSGRDCNEIASTIDLLPTLTRLTGGKLPELRIDGKDIWPLMAGKEGAKTPHEALFFYNGSELHAVRSGPWKLHFPHPYLEVAGEPGKHGKPSNFDKLKPESIKDSSLAGIASRHGYKVMHCGLELYNLDNDIGEAKNIAGSHPDVVRRLEAFGDQIRLELGDSLTGKKGTGNRAPGKED